MGEGVRRICWPLSFALCLSVYSVSCKKEGEPGCSKDTDCKGDRICEKGRCVFTEPDKNSVSKPPVTTKKKKPNDNKVKGSAGQKPLTGSGGKGASAGRHGGAGALNSPGLLGGILSVQVCQDGKCRNLEDVLSGDPAILFKLFGQMGARGGKDPKLKICASGVCVDVDKDFGKNPQDIFRMFGMMGGLMMGGPFPGSGSSGPLGGGSFSPKAPTKKRDPADKITFKSSDAIISAGDAAVGKVAQLSHLVISVVQDNQAVFKGSGNLLVVLDIPKRRRFLVQRLRTHTKKVTVTFFVKKSPLPNLVNGEFISFR